MPMRVAFTIMLTLLFTPAVFAQDLDAHALSIENNLEKPKNGPIGTDFGIYFGYGWNSQGCSQCYDDQWTGGWLVGMDYLYHPFHQLKGDGPNQYVSGAYGSNNLYISLGINTHDFDFVP